MNEYVLHLFIYLFFFILISLRFLFFFFFFVYSCIVHSFHLTKHAHSQGSLQSFDYQKFICTQMSGWVLLFIKIMIHNPVRRAYRRGFSSTSPVFSLLPSPHSAKSAQGRSTFPLKQVTSRITETQKKILCREFESQFRITSF